MNKKLIQTLLMQRPSSASPPRWQSYPQIMRLSALLTLWLGELLVLPAMAATLHVPADYTTMQAAVNAAAPSGDEIRIASGIYTQQVLITNKKLALTGSIGTVLQAWTGMYSKPEGPVYNLVEIRTNADVVIRNIEFDGRRLAASMPDRSAGFCALRLWGANGRVENCVFRGFRGSNNLATPIIPPVGGRAWGIFAINPSGATTNVVHVQVLNCTFSDNAQSMTFAGDYGWIFDPSLHRMTFVAQGNTVTGVTPAYDHQFGMVVLGGASGIIKNNRILNHSRSSIGSYWSLGIYGFPEPPAGMPMATPLEPLRIEGNTFIGNQKHLVLLRGDNSHIINNVFDGTGSAVASDGVWLTGSNVLTAINLFTNLSTGVHLASQSGVAVNPSLLANRFCSVNQLTQIDYGVINPYDLGSEYCPWPAEGFGNLICSPHCGQPGATVRLSGTNLTGVMAVLFNGINAEFTPGVDPASEIVATVPPHATTGPVTVITQLGNITGLSPFTVPVVLSLALRANEVHLTWCVDACDLVLETSSDLATPDWQGVTTSPVVGTELVTWTGPVGKSPRYFRLRQPPGP